MNSNQKRTFQAFRRIQGWLIAHPELTATQQSRPTLVTPGTKQATTAGISPDGVAKQVAAFNSNVDFITLAASDQEVSERDGRGATVEAARTRKELVAIHMRHIAVVAETAIPDVVRMTVALQRPRVADVEGTLAAADAMAKAAVQYRAELVSRGLPTDFIEQLQRAAAAYKQAIDTRGAARGKRALASSALETSTRKGKALLRTLSVFIERRFADDVNLLAEWRQLKHVVASTARIQAVEDVYVPSGVLGSMSPQPVRTSSSEAKAAAA
jgi:hypothetical protein